MTADQGRAANPARLYFGWRIAFAMFLTTVMVYGNLVFSFIILKPHLSEEFGWTSAATGSLVSAVWLVSPVALVVAPVIHRFGALRMIIVGMLVQAVTFALLGSIDAFWQLYLLRVVMGLGKLITIISVPVMMTSWFSARFGTAMAFAWCGGSVGGFILSPTTEYLLSLMSWRSAAITLGGVMLAVTGIIYLLCRGPQVPADLGLAPDGGPLGPASADGNEPVSGEDKPSFSELKSINVVTAVIMGGSLMIAGTGALAMQNQMPAVMQASGISAQLAATLLGVMSAAAALGQFGMGWLLDRKPVVLANTAVAALLFTGLITLSLLHTMPGLAAGMLAAASFGLGLGAIEMMWIILTKRQFGTRLFAYTYGGWSFALATGYALGGPIGGWVYDRVDVQVFPLIVLGLYLPSLIVAVFRPGKRNEP